VKTHNFTIYFETSKNANVQSRHQYSTEPSPESRQ